MAGKQAFMGKLGVVSALAITMSILIGVTMEPKENGKTVSIFNASTGTVEQVSKIERTDEEWRRLLTPEQYRITRLKGTEAPSSGTCALPPEGVSGVYQCVGCGTDLFKVETKFESGTGWPSFFDPVSDLNVRFIADRSLARERTEVVCARCGAHLGHVFDDGPPPTGKRFCINSVTLKLATGTAATHRETATFAAGCFWGVEAAFRKLMGKGVISTRVGYTGGDFSNPTYEDVKGHQTGHLEAVEVVFDPALISYQELLAIFWRSHNPLRSDGQGPDIGPQYRAAVFYHSTDQQLLAEESRTILQKSLREKGEIATMILPAQRFWLAEDYHQHYYEKKGIEGTCPVY